MPMPRGNWPASTWILMWKATAMTLRCPLPSSSRSSRGACVRRGSNASTKAPAWHATSARPSQGATVRAPHTCPRPIGMMPHIAQYVGAFFSVAPAAALGKKSAGPHRVAAADAIGSRLPPADVYDCRGLGVGRVAAAAQSPGVSSASRAAARGRRARGMWVWSPMQIIFVVKNRFPPLNFTCKSSITRVTSSLSRARCPGGNSHPLRRWGPEVPRWSESILSEPKCISYHDIKPKSKLNDAVGLRRS